MKKKLSPIFGGSFFLFSKIGLKPFEAAFIGL
jgi:hypothetical protein